MVKLTKIYTRTGDKGETGLADGSRLRKTDPRMAAIGDVDETNSAIGVAIEAVGDQELRQKLRRIQNELFDLGADLATPGTDFMPSETTLRVTAAQVERLEADIDAMNARLAPLSSFILPGGGGGAAALHLARSVARRAERAAIAAEGVNPLARIYLNRLSDHLFVMARLAASTGGGEILWQPGATR